MSDCINIAVVTTAKNESKNVDKLVNGILKQGHIKTWLFIDDCSDDNTLELIYARKNEIDSHVNNFIILSLSQKEDYALGPKYSKNIKHGFDYIKNFEIENDIKHDYFAILDADNYIDENYYQELHKEFVSDPELGIASGKTIFIVEEKLIDSNESDRWAAGSNRVWRRDCLFESGYVISYSADAVSAARARSFGWKVRSFKNAKVSAREVGERIGQEYYGRSCYIRHVPFYFVLLSSLIQVFKGRFHVAKGLVQGYLDSKNKNESRINDELAIKYFKNYLYNNISERING